MNAERAREELDSWIKVRHAIAHGSSMPSEKRYQHLVTGRAKGQRRLLRRDADRCLNFFERLVAVTATEANKAYP